MRHSSSSETFPRKNGYLRAKDPGPAATSEVRMKGTLLHPIEVTAWRTWQGPLHRRATDLQYLKDAYPR